MTPEAIHAIEQVLLINKDICQLYEKRGVSRDDLREIFTLASIQGSPEMDDEQLKEWLNAVIDAQTEWDTLTAEEQAYETGADPADEYWGFFSVWRKLIQDECYNKAFPPGEVIKTPPKWYEEQDILRVMDSGTFLEQNESLPAGVARHLQLAFEKGFSLNRVPIQERPHTHECSDCGREWPCDPHPGRCRVHHRAPCPECAQLRKPDHELKCWPEFFDAIASRRKPFDVRVGEDRKYEVGQLIEFKEWVPPAYTGRMTRRKISYVMHGGPWLPADVWVMGLEA